MTVDYPSKSRQVQSTLMKLGLTQDRLAMIGSFVVAYGLFETNLERALWALKEVDVKGIRPFTERLTTEKRLDILREGNAKLSESCNLALHTAAQVATDLNEYRNSLIHGQLVYFGDGAPPTFLKNTAWHGEVRNKQFGDAHITEPLLDQVLIATWTLFRLMNLTEKSITSLTAQTTIENMMTEINQAKSYASEARHISRYVNYEKY